MVSKYDGLKILRMTKSRKYHSCSKCAQEIVPGENYYKEHIKDKYIHTLGFKKYCASCYERYGDQLLRK